MALDRSLLDSGLKEGSAVQFLQPTQEPVVVVRDSDSQVLLGSQSWALTTRLGDCKDSLESVGVPRCFQVGSVSLTIIDRSLIVVAGINRARWCCSRARRQAHPRGC
jgi:hypothetical protein